MRRILLNSTTCVPGLTGVLVGGLAALGCPAMAEVTVGGDGYMGAAVGTYDDEGIFESRNGELSDYAFVYDLDFEFTATGTSDSGLTFGAAADIDDIGEGQSQGPLGYNGEIFVSGDFGTLAMGDIDGSAEQVVGDLAGVGITGLGDFNEMLYLTASAPQPSGSPVAAYTYEIEALTLGVGVTDDQDWTIGAGYEGSFWSVGIGYESILEGTEITIRDAGDFTDQAITVIAQDDAHQTIGQASVTFSGVTLKGSYGLIDASGTGDAEQWGLSAVYNWEAWSFAGYYRQFNIDYDDPALVDLDDTYAGLGAFYDLGGGLQIGGGVSQWDFDELPSNYVVADFGITMVF